METPFSPETESMLQEHGGPLALSGQQGNYVVMRSDAYDAMLGLDENEEAEALASVRRGIEDVRAGRTQDISEAFKSLTARYDSKSQNQRRGAAAD